MDTTVQDKAIAHPMDSRLLEIRAPQGGQCCQARSIQFKQTFAKEGKALRPKAGGDAIAKQFRRLHRVLTPEY